VVFSREAVEEIPVDRELVGFAVAKHLNVLGGVHALIHQGQHPGAEALDPGLNMAYPGVAEQGKLVIAQVSLDLVVESQIPAAPPRRRRPWAAAPWRGACP